MVVFITNEIIHGCISIVVLALRLSSFSIEIMILSELEKSLLFIFSSTLIKPLLGSDGESIGDHYHRDVVLQFHFQPDQEYLNDFANRHDLVYHSKILDQYYKFVNKRVRRRN